MQCVVQPGRALRCVRRTVSCLLLVTAPLGAQTAARKPCLSMGAEQSGAYMTVHYVTGTRAHPVLHSERFPTSQVFAWERTAATTVDQCRRTALPAHQGQESGAVSAALRGDRVGVAVTCVRPRGGATAPGSVELRLGAGATPDAVPELLSTGAARAVLTMLAPAPDFALASAALIR